ncbi:MAG: metallophosphoesterase [Polyangiaceae bacterium]|nr:metallophosphoesterase [Polyangiaceae bacterium]
MSTFEVNRTYDPALDARDYGRLPERLLRQPDHGILWPIVAARRGGKTWTLRAMERRLNELEPRSARYLDLREAYPRLPAGLTARCLLLDEPQIAAATAEQVRDPARFLAWCARLHKADKRLVLAMTPAEWSRLREADAAGLQVSTKDLQFIAPLRAEEADRLARTEPARRLLDRLPPGWQRSPFLLELVFAEAESAPALADRLPELIRAALARCESYQVRYVHYVFHDGLSEPQRDIVRSLAWGEAATADEILRGSGLVAGERGEERVADPILWAHLAPLRVHHVSDVHIGPKSAAIGDVKERDPFGRALGFAVGAGLVRDGYVRHVAQLAARGRAPHLVVISGDIAEHADPGQYREALAWVDALRARLADHPLLRPDDPRVLVVGGNHDVDWKRTGGDAGERDRHAAFAEAFAEHPHPHLERPPESRGLAKIAYPDLGVEIVLLGSSELGGQETRDPDEAQILALVDRLRAQSVSADDVAAAERLGRRTVRVDPGLIHRSELDRIKAEPFRQPVRVAVLHHPLSHLPATEVARFGGLLNAGDLKATLLEKGFCLVLHGHVHKGWFGEERWPDRYPDRTLRIAAAPSLASYEVTEHNGYNEIEIRRDRQGEERPSEIVVRRIGLDGAQWVPMKHARMGPFSPPPLTGE